MTKISRFDDPRYIKALRHPARVRILALLGEQEMSPRRLAPHIGLSLGATAYHVRALEKLGLIELAREGRVRGAVEHFYRVTEPVVVSEGSWEEANPLAKQAVTGASLQLLNDHARLAAAAGGFDHAEATLAREVVDLDEQGWRDLAGACQGLMARLQELGDESRARAEEAGQELRPACLAVLAFDAVRLSDQPPSALHAGVVGSVGEQVVAAGDDRAD